MTTVTSHLFITGTDTGVGKSIFTSIIALWFFNQGKKVTIIKPVQTGRLKDTEFLSKLTKNKIPVFNSYSFKLPAAPLVASKYKSQKISVKKIISDIRKLEKDFEHVIVEGIGGIAVPILKNYLVADLIKDLNYPVIIVCRPSLGTINHSVLTIEFAKQKKLKVLGFVVSGYDKKTKDVAVKTAPEIISKITKVPCLMKIPVLQHI